MKEYNETIRDYNQEKEMSKIYINEQYDELVSFYE